MNICMIFLSIFLPVSTIVDKTNSCVNPHYISGGNFVCKLFDLFTPFSVGLVYLMNMIFERVAIIKPVTSRPANSERYLIDTVKPWYKVDFGDNQNQIYSKSSLYQGFIYIITKNMSTRTAAIFYIKVTIALSCSFFLYV